MARKPLLKPSLAKRVASMHWSIKWLTGALGLFVAMGSAAATWDSFGWWKPASVWYVNERVKPLSAIQLDLANGKRESTVNDLAKWQLELNKTKDPASLEIISRQLNLLEATKHRLDKQIEELERRQ
ncbi:MAG TPA: hypothetical protein VIY48_04845 [Candidatus Paceibacterota bacterium]